MSADRLPEFRYHPDPLATGSIVASDVICPACELARGFAYVGPVFSEHDHLDGMLCPWCIADGTAHARLGVSFTDAAVAGYEDDWLIVPESVLDTISSRTPGFCGWQEEHWMACCGDGAAFLGRVGRTELELAGEQAVASMKAESGYTPEEWTYYYERMHKDGDVTGYLFQCLHCGRYCAYSDCS